MPPAPLCLFPAAAVAAPGYHDFAAVAFDVARGARFAVYDGGGEVEEDEVAEDGTDYYADDCAWWGAVVEAAVGEGEGEEDLAGVERWSTGDCVVGGGGVAAVERV